MANLIPEDKITEIKSTANIFDVVSEVVLLKKAGRNYLGLCPFHSEKTPSFTVSPEKQIFHCFGCGEGGNIFSFLMKLNGFSFPEAVRTLARRYGIHLPTRRLTPEERHRINERESLLAANQQAMLYYRNLLAKSGAGQTARAYLNGRGMGTETVDAFDLGFAPDRWDGLLNYMASKKVPPGLIAKAGLVVPRQNQNGYYDRFRNRIIFPIYDLSNQVIAFGGRVMDDQLPKYLNSPETPVYHKSRSLYGLHRAKGKCRETSAVFIVEGYFDLLALHHHGISNSVATLGTALTQSHLRLLKGFASRMTLVYDSDAAGIKAAQRSVGLFMQESVDARVVVLPAGQDPDSYIFEHGTQAFLGECRKAPGLMTFLIESAIQQHGLSIEGKIRIMDDLHSPIASIADSVARALYIKELAERLEIDENAIVDRMGRPPAGQVPPVRPVPPQGVPGRGGRQSQSTDHILKEIHLKENRLEKQILAMMLHFPEIVPDIRERNVLAYFHNKNLRIIAERIVQATADVPPDQPQQGDPAWLIDRFENPALKRLIASLAIQDESWEREACYKLLTQFMSSRKRSNHALLKQIKAAEADNDHERLLELLRQKQNQATQRQTFH